MKKEDIYALYQSGQPLQAKEACQSLCKVDESDPDIWCLLAAINCTLASYEDAEQCGLRAIELSPDYIMAIVNTALAQFHLEKIDAAKEKLSKVLSREPNNWIAHFITGQCYDAQKGNDELIIASYERALDLSPQPQRDLVVKLASAYERVGEIEKYCRLVDQYLSDNPYDPVVGLMKARKDEHDGQLNLARKRIDELLTSQNLLPFVRAPLLGRLGLILDKLGEYTSAFDAFKECNSLTHDSYPQYNRGYWYDRIHRNTAVTTPENLLLWKQHAHNDDIPAPIFLIGFPRSGTTLTERILSSHSDVIVSSEEPLLLRMINRLNVKSENGLSYPYNLNDLTSDQVSYLRRAYWSLAQEKCGAKPVDRLFLDKLPLNIIELCFIWRIFPEAKIILVIRDPRDVCLSCFMQDFNANDAMANFYDLESAARFYDSTMKLFSHYEAALELNIFKLRYEDLVSNMQDQVSQLLNFLGLGFDDGVLKYYQNRGFKNNTPSYDDTTKPPYTSAIGRWKNYRDYIEPIMPYLQLHLETFGYNSN